MNAPTVKIPYCTNYRSPEDSLSFTRWWDNMLANFYAGADPWRIFLDNNGIIDIDFGTTSGIITFRSEEDYLLVLLKFS